MRQKLSLTKQETAAIGATIRGWNLETRAVEKTQRRARRLREEADKVDAEARRNQAAADEIRTQVVLAFLEERVVTEFGATKINDMRIDGAEFSFDDGRTAEQYATFVAEQHAAKKRAEAEVEAKKKADEKLLADSGRELAEKGKNRVAEVSKNGP